MDLRADKLKKKYQIFVGQLIFGQQMLEGKKCWDSKKCGGPKMERCFPSLKVLISNGNLPYKTLTISNYVMLIVGLLKF